MKKICYLLLFVLTLSAAANAQTAWVTTKIDNKISVKFPAEPVKMSKPTGDLYVYRAADSLAYSAAMLDMNIVVHLDSTKLAQVKDMQQFADQLVKGVASSKKNYTFGAVTIGQWKTYTCYNVSAKENTNNNSLLMQMILIGSKMYMLSCRIPAGMVTKNNEVFFSSVEVLK
jgi:hypothetical protein